MALFNEVAFIAASFLIKDQLWFENKEKHEQHELHLAEQCEYNSPAGNHMFKVNNRNTKRKVWNMFKVNNKDTKTMPLALLSLLLIWTYFTPLF